MLSKKEKNQIIDFFEERNFNANFIEDNRIELETFSKAGEKLIDYINGESYESIKKDLVKLWSGFDVEEHVLMRLEAKKNGDTSIPSVVALVEDAKSIEKMYEQLWCDFDSFKLKCLYLLEKGATND